MIICIGPVCIPLWGLAPFVLAVLAQLKDTILAWLGLKKPAFVVVHPAASKSSAEVDKAEGAGEEKRVVEAGSIEEFNAAVARRPLAIVDFSATWCGPCKKIAPVFEDEALLRGDVMTFIKVDIEALEQVAEDFKISSLPCFVLLENGKEIARDLAGANEARLRAFIAEHVKVE